MGSDALLDTHCHVAHFDDPQRVLRAATSAGVDIVAVTNSPDEYRRFAMRVGHRTGVEVALGLHPLEVRQDWRSQVLRLLRMVNRSRWIGEIGLDFSREGRPTRRDQRAAFEALLAEAQVTSRPMTIHSRGAAAEVIQCLEEVGARAILHWFTGTPTQAERGAALGCWFSVNSAMTRSTRGRALLDSLPRDRILLETDGPYVDSHNRPFEPSAIRRTVDDLAAIWRVDRAEVFDSVVRNQRKLLSRSS